MKETVNKSMTYRVEGTTAIKVRSACIYNLSTAATSVEQVHRPEQIFGELLKGGLSVVHEFKTGTARGIPISGVTLSHKLVSLLAAIAFTSAIILITNLL
ncbi:MAG: hypothetical protein GX562_04665 [Coriobacteriaceae bacterium]|nr:hypothetical protein [Coriobacteriaceae bacterium]